MDREAVDAKTTRVVREAWPVILLVLQLAVLVAIAEAMYLLATSWWLELFALPPVLLWAVFVAVFVAGMTFGAWFWDNDSEGG